MVVETNFSVYTKQYLLGVAWFILSLFASTLNDGISKYVGNHLHSSQVVFFRFFFSTIVLLPFLIKDWNKTVKNANLKVHFLRGILLFCGIAAWTYGLNIVPITTATILSFTIPIFTLVLAHIFLSETIIWQRWVATIVTFIGIFVLLGGTSNEFNTASLIFVFAAIGFASLDIINKIIISDESMTSMLFYSAFFTALLALFPALYFWVTPTVHELILCFILGISANLILFFILKAFSILDATAIAPYRYIELVISGIVGYLVFGENISHNTIYSALIVIPATLFIVYSENKKRNK